MPDPRHLRIQRELFLAAFGTHAGVTEAWITDRMTSLLEEQFARAGQVLYRAGDAPDVFFFMREGRVELVRDGSRPWLCEGRCVFGVSDAVLDRPRARTAVALSDVQVMRVQADAWMELLEDSFELARAAVAEAIGSVAGLEEKAWAVAGRSPGPRAPALVPAGQPLDVLARLALLVQTPLLRRAGAQLLSDLAAGAEVASFAEGDPLFGPGTQAGRVFVLVEGEVEARREAPDVRWHGGPGDVVCGTAAFGEPILAWRAHARTAGRALTFRVEDWLDLLEEHFEVVRATLGVLLLERDHLLDRLA